jgi:hypothetical protein
LAWKHCVLVLLYVFSVGADHQIQQVSGPSGGSWQQKTGGAPRCEVLIEQDASVLLSEDH